MGTFTVTTGTPGSPTNIDTLVGRTGGDTYAINGGFLLIDEDSRYGLNANTSAIMASITPSATLGGGIMFDGRAIRLIPFTGGSGTVPAFNTAITNGGATGKLIGVYSALNAAPLAPAAAMPATGWIKVKQWNGVLYGTGALGGITATAAAGETEGWLEIVGQESTLALVSSLNQAPSGSYDGSYIKGDWYTVGTTSGSRVTTYQIPTNGSLVWHGGVMVDKAPATPITAASWAGGVATFTSTAHGLQTDDRVMVDAILPRTWRTVDTQRCTRIDADHFSVPMAVNPGAYTSGGTVAAQEWWPITDSLNTKVGSEDYRGKFAWLDSTTGLLRFGNDSITSTGGALPASGLVIRLPNVTTANANSAAKTVNTLPSAVSTRHRFYNGNAGTIRADHMSGAWSPSVFQTGKSVTMSDCAVVGQISLSSQAEPCFITNCCVGGNGTTSATSTLLLSTPKAITTIDSVFSTGEAGARYPVNLSTTYFDSFDRCRFTGTGDRSSAQYSVNANIGSDATFKRCQFGPFGMVNASQFSNGSMEDCTFYGASYGIAAPLSFAAETLNFQNLSKNWNFDTFAPYGTAPLQRGSLLKVASGSDNIVVRNWGTFASPIDMRLNSPQFNKTWNRVTTVATVVENGHPYRVGDQVHVFNCTATGTITLVSKTITAVTTNDFSFACLNTGPTTGTMSYYVGALSNVLSTGGAANITVQNVHVRGNFAQPTVMGNTQYGMAIDNLTTEPLLYNLVPNIAGNNVQARSYYSDDYPVLSPVAAIFGTHFADFFVREPGTAVPGQAAAVTGCAWTRSGSTITVISPNHGIIGNNQRLFIENSTNTAAISNGWQQGNNVSLVVVDANTFTFTGVNSGSTSGTLDYWLHGDSVFRVYMNEESSATTGQAQITVNSGAAGFTGAGTMVLPVVGDQVTWTVPSLIKGYEGFAPRVPVLPYGLGLTTLSAVQQFDVEYQRDDGSGWGPWRNAAYYGSVGGGWGASGANTVTVTNSTGIQVNDYCIGPVGIANTAQFVSRQPGKLTMTNASTSTASAPDSVALQLTGSFTLDAKLTLTNWSAPSSAAGCIMSKGDSSTLTKGYYLRFTSNGSLTLAVGTGAAAVSATSSVSTSTVFTNGQPGWVRAVWDEPADQAKFYTSPDGVTWTQLGTTQALVGAAVGTSASTFFIGQRTTGNDFLAADIYRVRVYSDATQTTKVFDADFSTNATGAATLAESVNGAVVTTVGCQQVTLSANNTAAVSGVLLFWYTPNESAFPSTGVRFKFRVTANTANAASFYQVDVPLISSNTSRARLYDQTAPVPISITALDAANAPIVGARVRIVADSGGPESPGTLLLTGTTDATGTITSTYGFSSNQPITGYVRKATVSPFYKQSSIVGTVKSTGFALTLVLTKDE